MIEEIKAKIIETLKNSSYFSEHYIGGVDSFEGNDLEGYLATLRNNQPVILVQSGKCSGRKNAMKSSDLVVNYLIYFIHKDYQYAKPTFPTVDEVFKQSNNLFLYKDLGYLKDGVFYLTSFDFYDFNYKRIIEIAYNTFFSLD